MVRHLARYAHAVRAACNRFRMSQAAAVRKTRLVRREQEARAALQPIESAIRFVDIPAHSRPCSWMATAWQIRHTAGCPSARGSSRTTALNGARGARGPTDCDSKRVGKTCALAADGNLGIAAHQVQAIVHATLPREASGGHTVELSFDGQGGRREPRDRPAHLGRARPTAPPRQDVQVVAPTQRSSSKLTDAWGCT